MILLNGSEIIENVRIDKNGEIRIPDLPPLYVCTDKSCKYSNWSKSFKSLFCQVCNDKITIDQKREFVSTILPFIDVSHLKEGEWNYCEIGYIDIENLAKKYTQFDLNNVTILDICIKKDTIMRNPFSNSRYWYPNKICYSYEINIEIHQNSVSRTHRFIAGDLLEEDFTGKWDKKGVRTMKCLFADIIPLINEYLISNKPIELINFDYLDNVLPKEPDYISNCSLFSIHTAMNLVYYMEIEDTEVEKIVRFGRDMNGTMNYYMADLVNTILGINLKYDSETKTSYSILTNIPNKYSKSNETIKRYLSCLLYLSINCFYDEERANSEYLIRVPDKGLKMSSSINAFKKICISNDFEKIYNFIYGMEATHFQNGQYRVGRDDREWKEKYYAFPINSDYLPNDRLISKINVLLEIELQCNENQGIKKSYSFYEIYDKDYIAGMTEGRVDLGSEGFRRGSFHTLVSYFTDCYLNKFDEFQTYI